ncbi:rho guanine nucleotide exchange factor 39-like [Pomacea canaliculata]|uniref:rho guanine nucleotide exchange factor 39-like n=1 Tax=Pomacea canaliculata TaxID=400727 RepID=UPI000D739186|nr:rho guanine nucleotide exchange factor 39-like [Pomacea canaliculata]
MSELEPDLGDGVSFAASPAETEVQENLKREQRRCEIIKELIEAEKTYLNHLDIIHKFFYFPLQFNWIIPGDTHSHLFSNIEEINKVNRTLLEVMEQSTVGQAFRHLGPFLKVYATYVNNHEQALAVLQEWRQKKPEFADFITKQESRPELMKLSIKDLLIMPVQQIPRYRLLLEDLLEHTHKNHPDYLQLKEATIQMEKIVKHMNESMRQKENSQKMLAIQKCFDSSAPQILQPGRLFLKEGPLKKVSRKGGNSRERMFYLFNDMLLYGKPRLLDSGGNRYICCCVLPIKHCCLDSCGSVFKITCKEERLVLFSEEIGVAQSWSDAIEMAIRKAKRDFLTLKKTQQSQDTSTGTFITHTSKELGSGGLVFLFISFCTI